MSHHGTYAQYQKHRKAGEPPCEPCLIASREYMKGYRRKNVDQPLVAAIQAEGFAEGVKAARDAVAALQPDWSRSNEDGIGGILNGVAFTRAETFTYYIKRDSALAAIDAIQSTQNAASGE